MTTKQVKKIKISPTAVLFTLGVVLMLVAALVSSRRMPYSNIWSAAGLCSLMGGLLILNKKHS